jgi:hypothetical protein
MFATRLSAGDLSDHFVSHRPQTQPRTSFTPYRVVSKNSNGMFPRHQVRPVLYLARRGSATEASGAVRVNPQYSLIAIPARTAVAA